MANFNKKQARADCKADAREACKAIFNAYGQADMAKRFEFDSGIQEAWEAGRDIFNEINQE